MATYAMDCRKRFLLFLGMLVWGSGLSLETGVFLQAAPAPASAPGGLLKAGAAAVDISPREFPVVVNAMFTERSANRVVDRLEAKALAIDDGRTRVILCVVDSCMVPRDIIDAAKAQASKLTGVSADRMLVSATHTHSAPSAMGCLGSRVDPRYALALPAQIASAMVEAYKRMEPAQAAWTGFDDWEHTFNRRWIRLPDRLLEDPFGHRNVRAHMHPGHQSPDVTGPSGPVDPQITLVAFRRLDGTPISLLSNYSMHYYESELLSSDYFGAYAEHLQRLIAGVKPFVGIMSQGTSGDLMWMDYGAPRKFVGYKEYARQIAQKVAKAYGELEWKDSIPVRMAETKLNFAYRTPDPIRLAWARARAATLGDQLPQSMADIYALEAIQLHERQKTELILQALRIGDLGICAIPNEVFALTGLKIKAQSPLPLTMNIELANGAEGYIPPPEQHYLGGYTTWPARTAGLETQAEPRIVEALLGLLESVAGKPRRPIADEPGFYTEQVLVTKPIAFWRLNDMSLPWAQDASGFNRPAFVEYGVAFYLPGIGSGTGVSPTPALTHSAFSGTRINRAIHTAGGRLRSRIQLKNEYSIVFWAWNGAPPKSRAITGFCYSRGANADPFALGEHLGVAGTAIPAHEGKLILGSNANLSSYAVGKTDLGIRAWHRIAFVRSGTEVKVYLDDVAEPEITAKLPPVPDSSLTESFWGGRNDGLWGWEGRLDEVSVHDRALTPDELKNLWIKLP